MYHVGHTTVFSVRSILRKLEGHQQRSNSEYDIVAMRKDTAVLEREKEHHKELSSENTAMIAIRTPPITRICINCGLNIVKNRQA